METLRSSSEYLAGASFDAKDTIAPRAPFDLKNIKAIIFDFDRHLIDTDRAFIAWWETGITTLANELEISRDSAQTILTEAQIKFETIFFFHRLDLVEEIVRICSEKPKPITMLSQVVLDAADQALQNAISIRTDLIELLESASRFASANGIKMVMMTGGSKSHTIHKLEVTRITSYFDAIFCATPHPFEDDPVHGRIFESPLVDRVFEMPQGVTKSNPSGFAWTLEQIGVPASQAFNSGDHPIEDVRNMQLLGGYAAQSLYFHDRSHFDVTPDYIARSPMDLIELFRLAD